MQLLLGFQFVDGLLMGALASGSCPRRRDVGTGHDHRRSISAILRRAASAAASCFEPSSLKIGALLIPTVQADMDLGDPPVGFGKIGTVRRTR